MAEDTKSSQSDVSKDKELDAQIEQARKMHEKQTSQQQQGGERDTPQDNAGSSNDQNDQQQTQDDLDKITVDREYIHGLREEAKEYRQEKTLSCGSSVLG